ncbi:trypsin-like peptidase domain-containing protein [Flavobacterium sp. MAH-1]|uniref:Trypsin-like peptidase domain-containing protein n=1 Tax=Flavobacterium agri TaxID=2743471 RepID=A0A7Y9C6I4_9FLAO|nr:trypsin-like peptidase domain-containing protein [Flavobacterium agri]NUY82096.1 trypsin-like peptidase domain-containing protein [Flavobacterium agri]NYA72120.1 trypsin-like peptidase domain-containing protein [Flavobacterium agri]
MKRFSSLFLVSLLSGGITLGAYKLLSEENAFSDKKQIVSVAPENYTRTVGFGGAENVDFTQAADKAVHYVVHVKNVSYRSVSPMEQFFYGYRGGQQQEQVGTGSGVIISEDGYIVTNNHVIKDASELEVTLNNRKSYKAKLIGTDAKMDIALLKIDADDKLPYTTFANSDNIKVGEWVLAVGNPYNLTSTVTAGIVSAKARNLSGDGLQSFIQTDAAVNPGNSGGALVNTSGELVGINTMISSMTGSYVGYSFAVPSNIARKIVEDILEFGNTQRAIMGVQGTELNSQVSKELNLNRTQGFYIGSVNKNSGAEKAGLKKGDVITKLDDHDIYSFADFNGVISTKRPNDVVNVTFIRDAKTYSASVKLIKNEFASVDFKGMELSNLTDSDKKRFRVNYGLKIGEVNNERLAEYKDELEGGVILSIGNVKATDVETISGLLKRIDDNQSVQVQLMTSNGEMVRVIM